MNARRFDDKVVLVTGGNSGIGRATAIAFAAEGASVVIAARRENLGADVVDEITGRDGKAEFIRTDVTEPGQVEALFAAIGERYGRLNHAFNNAGTGVPLRRLANTTMEEWTAVMNTNLRGTWLCMKYEIPMIRKEGGGSIVNNSSVMGLRCNDGLSLYSASKHAILGLTRAAALEVAHRKVRVNAVCPGFVDTDMARKIFDHNPAAKDAILASVPLGRLAKPEEIAGAVLMLCSDAATFMTGKEIVIAGGQGIRP
ncbi:MAG TPA: glucose 1-dehydrogenase [Deltaproteobacteria bacterium]|nr:glucose 1-dehydrogenase [Deltaproteobacteria bacterium]